MWNMSILTIKNQLFIKLVQMLALSSKAYIDKYANLRSRVSQEEGLFFLYPRETELAEYSGELLFIRPRSALQLALARTVHNTHHGQSAELHERLLSRMYCSPNIIKYLHHLRSSCPEN
jgi:hypothetical protein